MEYAHSPIVGVIGAIFIFGLAIFAHELGHFIFAKLGKVGVKEFAIGMGPKLFSVHRGGTDYSIRAIPFGGFVMMEGAFPEEERAGAAEREGGKEAGPPKKKDMGESVMEDINALRNKSMPVKLSIFAAGVGFNFLAAVCAMGVKYSVGFEEAKPLPAHIAEVRAESALAQAGLQSLDWIRAVNGKAVENFDEFQNIFFDQAQNDAASSITLELIRASAPAKTFELPSPFDPVSGGPAKAYAPPSGRSEPSLPLASWAPPHLGALEEDSPFYRAGLREMDWIVAIDGRPAHSALDIHDAIRARIESKRTEPLRVEAIPAASPPLAIALPNPIDRRDSKRVSAPYRDPEDGESFALAPLYPAYVEATYPNQPADRAGILGGDIIVAVNGDKAGVVNRVHYFHELANAIRSRPNEPLEVVVRRKGSPEELRFYPIAEPRKDNPSQGLIGIFPGNPDQTWVQESIPRAFAMAFPRAGQYTVFIAVMTVKTLKNLVVRFKETRSEVAGPVGIVTMAYKASRKGFSEFLHLFIILNIALLVFNILPIPILDGGHIAICLIEGATRRRIPPRLLGWVFNAMAFLLIAFAIAITWQDIKAWWFKF